MAPSRNRHGVVSQSHSSAPTSSAVALSLPGLQAASLGQPHYGAHPSHPIDLTHNPSTSSSLHAFPPTPAQNTYYPAQVGQTIAAPLQSTAIPFPQAPQAAPVTFKAEYGVFSSQNYHGPWLQSTQPPSCVAPTYLTPIPEAINPQQYDPAMIWSPSDDAALMQWLPTMNDEIPLNDHAVPENDQPPYEHQPPYAAEAKTPTVTIHQYLENPPPPPLAIGEDPVKATGVATIPLSPTTSVYDSKISIASPSTVADAASPTPSTCNSRSWAWGKGRDGENRSTKAKESESKYVSLVRGAEDRFIAALEKACPGRRLKSKTHRFDAATTLIEENVVLKEDKKELLKQNCALNKRLEDLERLLTARFPPVSNQPSATIKVFPQ